MNYADTQTKLAEFMNSPEFEAAAKAMQELANSPVMNDMHQFANSPAAKAMQELANSLTAKLMQELVNSPMAKAMREITATVGLFRSKL